MKLKYFRQSSGAAYTYLAQSVPLMCGAFMRHIYLDNVEKVKGNTPILLASNHPTAFIDPILLGGFLDPPLYNMTRGDIFRKPFFRKMMESINMFPVYRKRDGYVSRDRNDEVFEYCIGKLQQRRVVTIYVEGEHHLEKRVRPLQKGLARIAFAAYERFRQPDLVVLPIGCNYWYGDREGDTAFIVAGEPIRVADYWPLYEASPSQAVNQLTRDLETVLKKHCYHIENPADAELGEYLLTLHRSEMPTPAFPQVIRNKGRFWGEKAVLDRLNTLSEGEKVELRTLTISYFEALQKAGVRDAGLMRPSRGSHLWLLLFLFGLPVYAAGWVVSAPVRYLSRWITQKTVRKAEFYTSVLWGSEFLLSHLLCLLIFFTGLLLWNTWVMLLAVAAPLLGWFTVFYQFSFADWYAAWKARYSKDRSRLLELREHCKTAIERIQVVEEGIEE